jgi:hypothetical protein
VADSATASELRRALGDICEYCGANLSGHRFAKFASAIGTPDEIPPEHPLSGFGCRRWREVYGSQEFEGAKDAVIVYALACPNCQSPNGKILDMVLIHDPCEMYAREACIDRISALNEEAETVYGLLPSDAWEGFE